MNSIKISLDDKDFLTLVRGGILTIEASHGIDIDIALQDIGYDHMEEIIENLRENKLASRINLRRFINAIKS